MGIGPTLYTQFWTGGIERTRGSSIEVRDYTWLKLRIYSMLCGSCPNNMGQPTHLQSLIPIKKTIMAMVLSNIFFFFFSLKIKIKTYLCI